MMTATKLFRGTKGLQIPYCFLLAWLERMKAMPLSAGNSFRQRPKDLSMGCLSVLTVSPAIRASLGARGSAQLYHGFIPNLVTVAEPLRSLTRNETPWRWDSEEERSFQRLKDIVSKVCSTGSFQ